MSGVETFLTQDIGTKTNFKLQEFTLSNVAKEKCKLNNKQIDFKSGSGYKTFEGSLEINQALVKLELKEKGTTSNDINCDTPLEQRTLRNAIGAVEAYFFVLMKYDETDETYKPFKLP